MSIVPAPRSAALLIAYMFAACGGEDLDGPRVQPLLHISAALHTQTQTLAIHALGPQLTDDTLLTCSSLRANQPGPTDPRVESLASANILVGAGETTAELRVAKGDGRIFFVEAVDGAGKVVGNGCQDKIKIKSGDNSVNIDVFPTF